MGPARSTFCLSKRNDDLLERRDEKNKSLIEAQGIIIELEETYPHYQLGYVLRAAHYLQVGETKKAIKEYLRLAEEGGYVQTMLASTAFGTDFENSVIEECRTPKHHPPCSRTNAAYIVAKHDVNEAVTLSIADYDNYPNLSVAIHAVDCLLFLGEIDEAKKLASQALDKAPKSERTYFLYKERLELVVSGGKEEAFMKSTQHIDLHDMRFKALKHQLGMLCLARGDTDGARGHFKESVLLEQFPDAPRTVWGKKFLKEWLGDENWLPPGPRVGQRGDSSNE